MTGNKIYLLLALSVSGCAVGTHPKQASMVAPASVSSASVSSASKATQVSPISHEVTSSEMVQPVDFLTTPPPILETPLLKLDSSYSLESLENIAFSNNPAIAQASARVRALRGKRLQAGIAPNPSVGYLASEVGNEGEAGQQGTYFSQEIVTANKLEKNRAIVSAEISKAEQNLSAIQQRVRTDVRQNYYQALIAQRRVSLAEDLVQVTSKAVEASQALLDAQEIPIAGLLQTMVQQQNAVVMSKKAENQLEQEWRNLSAVVGESDLVKLELDGKVDELPSIMGWQEELVRLQTESPEIAAAIADIERARRALSRACVEAVPNINTQFSVQYDYATEDTVAGMQVGVALPLWNRNQGGIQQARAQIAEATSNVQRIELDLQKRLSNTFRQYSDANVTATAYASQILPRTKQTLEIVRKAYEQGEVSYLELLMAQKTFSETNLDYLDALSSLWASYTQINGLLLQDSLSAPN